ncbi:uncharacterized protein LOC132561020 [Ylistrum balloti]|uniref:uncharacterized protein LOC132561020 n=1 Tax=Ylistrum balloti TaxID=509963 RepID=UPI002905F3D8|nr:uncharacterized protein LOC132561020 [Ylistrum balloti]XP_060081720.1 uncharacterized protein LOC132561020 [Ylistrum balloti]XP_060081721.1 uncharacterized protein LOC132561020 [Ylistrum balloti]XP_060081722.1 uncharacterized protein LOC132561020 [Ylistrum balloti]XP_060081723.1 uncharacterized protein LOC132561020 [Ylistrum balloti]
MPLPVQPRRLRTENVQGTTVHFREVDYQTEEGAYEDERLDEVLETGVDRGEEIGTVGCGQLAVIQSVSGYYDEEQLVDIHSQENSEGGSGLFGNNQVVIIELQRRGHDITLIQRVMDGILSERPNLRLTPEYVEREIQRLRGGIHDQDESRNIVKTGTVSKEQDMKELRLENQNLKERLTCKICKENESCKAYIPCGHLISCSGCFKNNRGTCAICKRHIDRVVNVVDDV